MTNIDFSKPEISDEVKSALQEFDMEHIHSCQIIIVNCDMTEIQQHLEHCETFKQADRFIQTVGTDACILRHIYVSAILIPTFEPKTLQLHEDVRLVMWEFDNYSDLYKFCQHANWAKS